MRPIRLALEGFTCFKDRQDPLELDGLHLFAISGPTGAGKSSLLDAMIFALFGKVPRMGKQGISELVSLGRERMAVTLDFRLGEQDYRVTRAVHRAPGRPTQAILEELHGELTRPRCEGVKNVDEEVRRLLGFDYDTFTRAVILPQGEFANFMKSRPGERHQILRELLRLQVFEEMRRLAGEEKRQLKARIEGDQRRLEEDYADATPAELGRRRSEASRLKKSLRALARQLKGLRARLQELQRQREQSRELEDKRAQAAQLARKEPDVTRAEARLEAAKRAAPVLPAFDALAELAMRAERQLKLDADEQKALKAAEKALAEATEALVKARREAREIPELRRRIEELDRVVGLLGPRDKARARVRELEAKLTALDREDDAAKKNRGELDKRAEKLARELETTRRDAEAIGYDRELDERLDQVRDDAGRLADRRAAAQREAARAEDLAAALRRLERDAARRDTAEAAARERWQRAERELRDKLADLRRAEHHNHVAVLRRDLAEGEPCPVCEQQVDERPETPDLTELDALDEAAAALRRREEEERRTLEAAGTEAAAARAALEAATRQSAEAAERARKLAVEVGDAAGALQAAVGEDVRDDPGETVEERVSAAVQRVAQARAAHAGAAEKVRAAEEELAALERARERLGDEAGARRKRRDELVRDLESSRTEADAYDRQIREVTAAEDPSGERRTLAETVAAREERERNAADEERRRAVAREGAGERAEKVKRSLEELRERIGAGFEKARADAEAAGFEDEKAVRSAALPEEKARRLDERTQAYRRERHAVEGRIAELEEGLDGAFVSAAEVTSQEKALRKVETRESDERRALGALEGSLGDLEQRITRRAELELELTRRGASHARVHQLTGDLRSERFQAYLLEKTFRELVRGASVRLMELSQRYTLEFLNGNFWVLDHDNAGQLRSADTLSGGETFLASVSLALELSEQIQREAGAVSLDSIFIDEGFGTLDPETLELVTGAVESLPTGGRMVGIITHIPELTRRLPFRIWVDKNPTGSRYRVEEG